MGRTFYSPPWGKAIKQSNLYAKLFIYHVQFCFHKKFRYRRPWSFSSLFQNRNHFPHILDFDADAFRIICSSLCQSTFPFMSCTQPKFKNSYLRNHCITTKKCRSKISIQAHKPPSYRRNVITLNPSACKETRKTLISVFPSVGLQPY
jgi:hypothetical protein